MILLQVILMNVTFACVYPITYFHKKHYSTLTKKNLFLRVGVTGLEIVGVSVDGVVGLDLTTISLEFSITPGGLTE